MIIHIQQITPDEYLNGGKYLPINYSFTESPFGEILIASTPIGICLLVFADNKEKAFGRLKKDFPKAVLTEVSAPLHQHALSFFSLHEVIELPLLLHIKGTPFQLKVWEALLQIPLGKLTTYGDIARAIKKPTACRAVGTAIGQNPVSYLIPCHRVIRSTGDLGGYEWGTDRKKSMIAWEKGY